MECPSLRHTIKLHIFDLPEKQIMYGCCNVLLSVSIYHHNITVTWGYSGYCSLYSMLKENMLMETNPVSEPDFVSQPGCIYLTKSAVSA